MNLVLLNAPWRFAGVLACWLLTACAASPPVQQLPLSNPHYTLAIFPWHISSHRSDESYQIGWQTLEGVLKGSDFFPAYSYYRFRQTPEIPAAMRPKLEAIWDNVEFPFSLSRKRNPPDHVRDPGPNLEPVYGLGQQLDVDAILMYEMDPQRSFHFMWIYLLDVRQRRAYFDGVNATTGKGVAKLTQMTREVFANYIQGQPKK